MTSSFKYEVRFGRSAEFPQSRDLSLMFVIGPQRRGPEPLGLVILCFRQTGIPVVLEVRQRSCGDFPTNQVFGAAPATTGR